MVIIKQILDIFCYKIIKFELSIFFVICCVK